MKKYLKYGLIFGGITALACFGFFLVMYFMTDTPLSARRPDLGINIILIGAAIWYYKKSNKGYLHFYEGFSVGFLTNIFASLFTGLLIYLFLQVIDFTPYEKWMEASRQMLINDRPRSKDLMSDATFETMLKSFDNKNSSVIITDELIFKQIAIIAITLFSMAFRRIKP